jgi:hypothetical protein
MLRVGGRRGERRECPCFGDLSSPVSSEMVYGAVMEMSRSGISRWMRTLGPLGKDARLFAGALGSRRGSSSELLVVGVPEFEPWHFVAHMGEQAFRYGRPDLMPTLMRWEVPPGSPAHLSVSVDSMHRASSGQTVLVINPSGDGNDDLLERVADAKRRGSRIMTLHRGDTELVELSHETLSIESSRPARDFDLTQHVVTDLTPLVPERKSA